MTPENFNWKSFTHGILLSIPLQHAFELIATAGGLAAWFIGDCTYTGPSSETRPQYEVPHAGDSYFWKWYHKDFQLAGQVREVERNRWIRVTFGRLFNVTLSVAPEGDRTRVLLKQEYEPGAAEDLFSYVNCCVCWVFFLTNLKSVAEYQLDLRETEVRDEMLVNC